jgi:hypothetical protein
MLERVMGIEYIADLISGQVNQHVTSDERSACDFGVKSAAMAANASHSGEVRTVPGISGR